MGHFREERHEEALENALRASDLAFGPIVVVTEPGEPDRIAALHRVCVSMD